MTLHKLPCCTKYDWFNVGHVNTNSVQRKSGPLRDALSSAMPDMLFIRRQNWTIVFPKCQFDVPGFKMYRPDQSSNKEGIMILIKNDIPHKGREDLENIYNSTGSRSEAIVMEVTLKREMDI